LFCGDGRFFKLVLLAVARFQLHQLHPISIWVFQECPAAEWLVAWFDREMTMAAFEFAARLGDVVHVDSERESRRRTDFYFFAFRMEPDEDVASVELAPVALVEEQFQPQHIAVKRDAAIHVTYDDHYEPELADLHYVSPSRRRRKPVPRDTSYCGPLPA